VHLDDHGSLHSQRHPHQEHRSSLVGALRDHHIRLEPANLAHDPEGQASVEPNPVEQGRRERPDELEPTRRIGTPRGGTCENAQVERTPKCVELREQARVQRELVPHPADEQNARSASVVGRGALPSG